MKIADNGSWLNETNEGHCFDEALAKEIVQFCNDNNLETVLDLGCGDGSYVHYIESHTPFTAVGIDGNPNTEQLTSHHNSECWWAELHEPLKFTMPMDLILSLEVGEHIPAEYEDVFLDNVVKYAKNWIILSWAIPGQGGDGHVNCRSNGWIAEQLFNRDFYESFKDGERLRENCTLPWMKNTVMVFKRMAGKG